ncbi:hypothetical protein M9H77_35027 [Catharanthus roseus]|uniref:Uncharacterized protein n=1 Tax=Catharanthus roseus TaxID=4058 RepID=A0ACB9ZS31_CATRO|nr:hypothetical protein M9H77_35027 [Catharanthus roseus]
MNIDKVVASVLLASEANQVLDGQYTEESSGANKEKAMGKAKVPDTRKKSNFEDVEIETLWEELVDMASFRMEMIKLKLIQEFESAHYKLLENLNTFFWINTKGTQATERTETPEAPHFDQTPAPQ